MGQAKQRGTQAERVKQAISKVAIPKPAKLDCRHCHAVITEIEQMDITGMVGVDAVFTGLCECGHTTFAMAGKPQAVAKAMLMLDMQLGSDGIVGLEKI